MLGAALRPLSRRLALGLPERFVRLLSSQAAISASLDSPLSIDVGAHALPHPRKKTAGEDAHFVSVNAISGTAALGVADGVGGAADSAWYSAILMANCEAVYTSSAAADPREVMEQAWANARSQHSLDGRSTACVVLLDAGVTPPKLRAANLGDSAFWVLRRRESGRLAVLFKSRLQSFSFNCPFQLGWLLGEELSSPADAETVELTLQPDDTLVLATDGLFDALHVLEILEMVGSGLRRGDTAEQLARALVETAVELSKDPLRSSPVVQAMAREGLVARAREAQDDVTVVVARVGPT